MASIASIFSMVAAVNDQPQPRRLRLATDADNTNQLMILFFVIQNTISYNSSADSFSRSFFISSNASSRVWW